MQKDRLIKLTAQLSVGAPVGCALLAIGLGVFPDNRLAENVLTGNAMFDLLAGVVLANVSLLTAFPLKIKTHQRLAGFGLVMDLTLLAALSAKGFAHPQ